MIDPFQSLENNIVLFTLSAIAIIAGGTRMSTTADCLADLNGWGERRRRLPGRTMQGDLS